MVVVEAVHVTPTTLPGRSFQLVGVGTDIETGRKEDDKG